MCEYIVYTILFVCDESDESMSEVTILQPTVQSLCTAHRLMYICNTVYCNIESCNVSIRSALFQARSASAIKNWNVRFS